MQSVSSRKSMLSWSGIIMPRDSTGIPAKGCLPLLSEIAEEPEEVLRVDLVEWDLDLDSLSVLSGDHYPAFTVRLDEGGPLEDPGSPVLIPRDVDVGPE